MTKHTASTMIIVPLICQPHSLKGLSLKRTWKVSLRRQSWLLAQWLTKVLCKTKQAELKNLGSWSTVDRRNSSMFLNWYLRRHRISTSIKSHRAASKLLLSHAAMTRWRKIAKQTIWVSKTKVVKHPKTKWGTFNQPKPIINQRPSIAENKTMP